MATYDEDEIEGTASTTLPSAYRELAKKRNENLLKLQNESEVFNKILSIAVPEDIPKVRGAHKRWLDIYENFLSSNENYQSILSKEMKEKDQLELRKDFNNFEDVKLNSFSWFTKYQQDDTRSHVSKASCSSALTQISQITSSKIKESTRKAELLARQAALEEGRQLEEEKIRLRFKEENLKIKTEIKISDARTRVLDDLEKSILCDEEVANEAKVKEEKKQPVFQDSYSNITHDIQSLGLLQMSKELNKPKVEINKFYGNPMDYHRFIRQFETKVVKNTDSYDERMTYLLQFTTGEANKIAVGFSHLDAKIGFKATLKEFKDRYGDSDVVANSYVKRALEWPVIKADDPKALDAYNIFLVECQYAVENVSAARVLDYQENIQKIVKKLPYALQERFRNLVFNLKESGKHITFEELVKFIKKESKKANDPIFGKSAITALNKGKPSLAQGQRKSFGANVQAEHSARAIPKCDYCAKEHWISSCCEIVKRSLKERYEILKLKGLCYSCLRRGHQKSECKKRLNCNICQRVHPTILHVDRSAFLSGAGTTSSQQEANTRANVSMVTTSGATAMGAGTRRVLPIVPVRVRQRGTSTSVKTYAFLDSGSNSTFCTESLKQKLNIEGRKRTIHVQTLNGKCKQESYCLQNLEVLPLDGSNSVDLPEIYTQASLPVNQSDLVMKSELNKWQYLQCVPLNAINSEVELLIGVDCPKAMEPWDVVPSENNGPFAVKTILGWVINGPLSEKVDDEYGNMKSNFIQMDSKLDQIVMQQYNHDFSERIINDVAKHSKEDETFMKKVEGSVRRENNHYMISLPFRDSNNKMPNNRNVAFHRLLLLRKRLENDDKLYSDYKDFMNKIIQKGYAKKVIDKDNKDLELGQEWYLPHHPVHHPRKGKLRVVFDCASRYRGTSLNDELLQGPNLTNTLIGTLLRFRQEHIPIVGDIESMFYQVRVPDRDANFLKFLWFEDGDITKQVIEYKMVVHLFGATSSPSCANFALRKTAIDHSDAYDSQVVNTVLKNFYVDDCLKSVPDVETARCLVRDLQDLLLKGGFRIHKWLSSSREVMSMLPATDRAVDLDLDQDTLPVERALGVQWSVESDEFQFNIDIPDRPLTRRGMLSMLSTVYDPLGFLAPLMLHAKNILKDLCRLGVGWDDPVTEEIAKRWTFWLNDLHKLSEFSVSRCFKPEGFQQVKSATLHHFSDASEVGYGIVSYLRLVGADDRVHCAFVMGKSRVTPMKQITVPRLELTAATVAVRTDKMLQSELDIELDDSVFWTDSMAVLRYIGNQSSRFQTFVANRLSVIHDGSRPEQWRYVATKLNPADIASRGVKANDGVLLKSWIVAPDFLWKNNSEWPESKINKTMSNDDPEVKRVNIANCVTDSTLSEEACEVFDKLMSYFSSWYRLKRAVAWIMKVRERLRDKVKSKQLGKCESSSSQSESSRYITVSDLDHAERAIFCYVQRCAFCEEIESLEKGLKLKKNSAIRNLDPVYEDGLLRVGGRLRESPMPEEIKHPVIIPKNSEISQLIIRDVHNNFNHVGRNHTLAVIRERYWIINGPSAVRKVITKCVVCRRQNASVGEQKMSNLPKDRITPDEPCFTHVGVDYFGPFEVKQGRSLVKRYGVIFTCLASRAVHIEVAASLDTDSYINALRRFYARRGQVRTIRSDNGSNFVCAEKELKRSIQEWNVSVIQDALKQRSIDWKFNPPAGSHHGGIWERMIRSIRQILKGVLKQQTLTDEALCTLMCEVEAILNSRPITKNSDSHDDSEALTPNHLLLLKRKPNLPPGVFVKTDNYCRRRWRQVQYMANLFWSRWTREYLPLLQERQKWNQVKRNLKEGDVVLVVDSNAPRNSWPLGKIVATIPDKHGLVRQVKLKTGSNTYLVRPIDKLCVTLENEN